MNKKKKRCIGLQFVKKFVAKLSFLFFILFSVLVFFHCFFSFSSYFDHLKILIPIPLSPSFFFCVCPSVWIQNMLMVYVNLFFFYSILFTVIQDTAQHENDHPPNNWYTYYYYYYLLLYLLL